MADGDGNGNSNWPHSWSDYHSKTLPAPTMIPWPDLPRLMIRSLPFLGVWAGLICHCRSPHRFVVPLPCHWRCCSHGLSSSPFHHWEFYLPGSPTLLFPGPLHIDFPGWALLITSTGWFCHLSAQSPWDFGRCHSLGEPPWETSPGWSLPFLSRPFWNFPRSDYICSRFPRYHLVGSFIDLECKFYPRCPLPDHRRRLPFRCDTYVSHRHDDRCIHSRISVSMEIPFHICCTTILRPWALEHLGVTIPSPPSWWVHFGGSSPRPSRWVPGYTTEPAHHHRWVPPHCTLPLIDRKRLRWSLILTEFYHIAICHHRGSLHLRCCCVPALEASIHGPVPVLHYIQVTSWVPHYFLGVFSPSAVPAVHSRSRYLTYHSIYGSRALSSSFDTVIHCWQYIHRVTMMQIPFIASHIHSSLLLLKSLQIHSVPGAGPLEAFLGESILRPPISEDFLAVLHFLIHSFIWFVVPILISLGGIWFVPCYIPPFSRFT